VPDAVTVPAGVPLVVTEGNYLLLDDGDWRGVAPLLDECWYVDVDEQLRLQRLVGRHVSYGRTPEQARARAYGSDLVNARLIEASRPLADRVVTVPPLDVDART
jgi:pantothenate kinase